MNTYSRRIAFIVAYITLAGGLWTASQWWEKGLATRRVLRGSSEDENDLGSGDLQRMPAIDTQGPQPSPEDDDPDMPIAPESLPA